MSILQQLLERERESLQHTISHKGDEPWVNTKGKPTPSTNRKEAKARIGKKSRTVRARRRLDKALARGREDESIRTRMLPLVAEGTEFHPAGNDMDVLHISKRGPWLGFAVVKERMSYMQPALVTKVVQRLLKDGRLKLATGHKTYDEPGSVVITPKGQKYFQNNLNWWT